jgi:acyl-[acyl-carrier-protein]-phospholipid O-acyltransferase/long-chain-fatty-acid--[acyl-carrier-protein] ligase
MKIYDGTGMIAEKSQAAILPIRLQGTEYTHFSRLRNIIRLRLFPKITITIQPHTYIKVPAGLKGKDSRKYSGAILANLMTEMMFETSHYRQTLFSALLEARKIHGGGKIVVEDMERKPSSYNDLITRTIIIGKQLKKITAADENVGVLLPNTTKTLNIILGLQLYGRVPAMLNYSIGAAGMVSACATAQIKTVLTSRRFIELAKLTDEAEHLEADVKLVYLEDIA